MKTLIKKTMAQTKTTSIQNKLLEKTKQLTAISKDPHFSESLIEDILNLKAQMCVEATELYVREKDVIEVLDFDSVCFKICTTGILFHAKSGYTTWIEPRCRSLFGEIVEMLKSKKEILALSEEERKKFDAEELDMREQFFNAWVHTLEMPVAASVSPKILFDTATAFLKSFREETDRMLKQPLHEENVQDLIDNSNVQQAEVLLDGIAEQMKEE